MKEQAPLWFPVTHGEKQWLSEMGNGKFVAYGEMEKGRWVGQYPLPGFRPDDYDILVHDPKKVK